MDKGIAEVRKSEKNMGGGGESSIEGAELSMGGKRGPPQKDTNWLQCGFTHIARQMSRYLYYCHFSMTQVSNVSGFPTT